MIGLGTTPVTAVVASFGAAGISVLAIGSAEAAANMIAGLVIFKVGLSGIAGGIKKSLTDALQSDSPLKRAVSGIYGQPAWTAIIPMEMDSE